MKVSKAIVLYPLGPYKSCTIRVDECTNWKEANETLRVEYLRMRDMLSEADQQRLDKLLK
jgi:hypothetical protein